MAASWGKRSVPSVLFLPFVPFMALVQLNVPFVPFVLLTFLFTGSGAFAAAERWGYCVCAGISDKYHRIGMINNLDRSCGILHGPGEICPSLAECCLGAFYGGFERKQNVNGSQGDYEDQKYHTRDFANGHSQHLGSFARGQRRCASDVLSHSSAC
ncbi:unnamed protein product [Polarella glacialis]|uniref:Uncharacterized protein n=1 Tax=Polarella glacialis TaxID=89957 RepID=A0A813GJK4_POLGL|nr:unnamed protein product [Polarella glacialis]